MWLLPGWFDDGWWKTTEGHDCTIEQMEQVAEGYFSPGDLVRNPNTEPGISGKHEKGKSHPFKKNQKKRVLNEATIFLINYPTSVYLWLIFVV